MYFDELGKRLIDEDEGDEESENLLGERWDVAHEEAALCCHDDDDDEDEPKANPHSTRQVLVIVGLAKLNRGTFIFFSGSDRDQEWHSRDKTKRAIAKREAQLDSWSTTL